MHNFNGDYKILTLLRGSFQAEAFTMNSLSVQVPQYDILEFLPSLYSVCQAGEPNKPVGHPQLRKLCIWWGGGTKRGS